jgi:YVTN family beta-propeller protein
VSQASLIRRGILLAAFALSSSAGIAKMAANQIPASVLVVVNTGRVEGKQRNDHSLVLVDPASGKVVGRVPITGAGLPHEVSVSDDGKLAFVTNTDYGASNPLPADFISVVDLVALKELHHIETGLGSYPHGVAFAKGKVYFTDEGYRVIGRYDPLSYQSDWMLGTGQHNMHNLIVTKDANAMFTSNSDSNSVTVVQRNLNPQPIAKVSGDPLNQWSVSFIPVGKAPDGNAMSPDEKEIWQTNRDDGDLSIIDVASKKVLETIKLNAKNPIRVKFTQDGKRVLIVCNSEGGEALILDSAARKEIKRIKVGDHPHALLVAPDGLHAYVSNEGGNDVAIIDLQTIELSGRITTGDGPEAMAWRGSR